MNILGKNKCLQCYSFRHHKTSCRGYKSHLSCSTNSGSEVHVCVKTDNTRQYTLARKTLTSTENQNPEYAKQTQLVGISGFMPVSDSAILHHYTLHTLHTYLLTHELQNKHI
eukprot:scpid104078/ scgid21543/ 